MSVLRRVVMTGTVIGALLALSAMPATAASNPRSSCVGTIVSTLAPAGALDVNDFKALAAAQGAPTFGAFVAEGARLHEGSLELCLP